MKTSVGSAIFVRLLQCCVVGAVIVAVALFSISVADGFVDWPEIAYIEPFVFVSIVVGTVLLLVALIESIDCFFSGMMHITINGVLKKLNIIRWIFGILTAYLVVAFAVFWYATQLMHPTIIIAVVLCCGIGISSVIALTLRMHQMAKNAISL